MNDIRRRDREVFLQALGNPGRLMLTFLVLAILIPWISRFGISLYSGTFLFATLGILLWTSYNESLKSRFYSRHMAMLWEDVQDRSRRMRAAIKANRQNGVATVSELPESIRNVENTLYFALRRADIVAEEVHRSEGRLHPTVPLPSAANDPQAQALLQVADRNRAEYRQALAGVLASVERTEAQAMVFITTLDGLRVRILGHRLAGRPAEADSMDFLSSMAEAKMQLAAIDKALDELELIPFPKTIVTLPPDLPATIATSPAPTPHLTDPLEIKSYVGETDDPQTPNL